MSRTACRRPGWKTTINCGAWLARARDGLSAVTENPLREAQSLLGHVLDQPRAFLLAHPEQALTPAQVERLDELLARRAAGEPLPYLLGHWEFFGLDFRVTPAVLIPRPETELLVEEALRWLRAHPTRRNAADVGTGSGCIAVCVACREPGTQFLAVDRSRAALEVARQNVERHAVGGRVRLAQMDLLSAAAGPLDLICANLPYIPTAKLAGLDVSRWEPRGALDGGAGGLDLIERLIRDAERLLTPGGVLLLEVEAGHGTTAPALARNLLPDAQVVLIRDLAGLPRLVRIQR
jgi:release factor glutamine methyltransferase